MPTFIPRLMSLCAIVAILSGTPLSSAAEDLTFKHQDVVRTAVVHTPASTVGRPAPLVIALHSAGSTGKGFSARMGLDVIADREKFVVVYPDAIAHVWSYGRAFNSPMPTVTGVTVDDVGFIKQLITYFVDRKVADPKRIYIVGSSRGGLMAYTVACALAEHIAAAAPLIAGMTEYQREDCQPTRPVPIMVVAGTKDPELAFDGMQGKFGRLLSVSETMDFWRSLHACARSDSRGLPHREPDDATHVTLIEWSGCRGDVKLRLYRVEGGGHQHPSLAPGASPMPEERFGPRNHDIETPEEVWAFFRGYVAP